MKKSTIKWSQYKRIRRLLRRHGYDVPGITTMVRRGALKKVKGNRGLYYYHLSFTAIIAIALASWAFAAHAQSTTQRDAPTTRFYDSRGNSTGSASTYGNQTRFYDSRGRSLGTTTHNGR